MSRCTPDLRAVHDLAKVLHYHSGRGATRLAGARKPVQELANSVSSTEPYLDMHGRVGVAYIVEGEGQHQRRAGMAAKGPEGGRVSATASSVEWTPSLAMRFFR
jgi:hypothetical protein